MPITKRPGRAGKVQPSIETPDLQPRPSSVEAALEQLAGQMQDMMQILQIQQREIRDLKERPATGPVRVVDGVVQTGDLKQTVSDAEARALQLKQSAPSLEADIINEREAEARRLAAEPHVELHVGEGWETIHKGLKVVYQENTTYEAVPITLARIYRDYQKRASKNRSQQNLFKSAHGPQGMINYNQLDKLLGPGDMLSGVGNA